MLTIALFTALRAKKPTAWLVAVAFVLLGALGLFPIVASTYLQAQGLYRVRVVALGLDRTPVDDAQISSSVGGEPKKIAGGWEFDIPPQARPADDKVLLVAQMRSAFLTGSSKLTLTQDYYPTVMIQLGQDTSAHVRGTVVDDRRRSIKGARVSVSGYPDYVFTDEVGSFALPAHAAEGQVVTVRAEKESLIGVMSVPAGNIPIEIVIRRP